MVCCPFGTDNSDISLFLSQQQCCDDNFGWVDNWRAEKRPVISRTYLYLPLPTKYGAHCFFIPHGVDSVMLGCHGVNY